MAGTASFLLFFLSFSLSFFLSFFLGVVYFFGEFLCFVRPLAASSSAASATERKIEKKKQPNEATRKEKGESIKTSIKKAKKKKGQGRP